MSQIARITEKPVFDLLQPKTSDIIRFIGQDEFKKEVSFAIQAANANDMLQQASPASVAKAVFNLAITGLSLNPVKKLAYLVPKRINGQWEAVLFPSYQGLVKLITDSGCASKVYAHVVYDGDDFDIEYGSEPRVIHRPKFKSKNITCVYAVAVLADGTQQIDAMGKDDIDEIMQRSDTGKKGVGPWKTDYPEMARKTVIRRIFKYLPKTDRYEKVAEAIALDEQDYPATMGQISFIESLLQTSAVDHDERSRIERNLSDMSSEEAARMIEFLQDNQLDKIAAGLPYNQSDISEKVSREIMEAAERADNEEQGGAK
jgi:phage RecT family recombinase